jgi:hypothetical protein
MSNDRIFFLDVYLGEKPTDVGFDCVPREGITSEAVVTKNPVEVGAEVSDHFYVLPTVVSLQIIVSNTPLREAQDDIVSKDGFGSTGAKTRASAAWIILKKIQGSAKPFTVQTGFERLTDMVITSMSAERTSETSGALICDIVLTRINLTKSKSILLPVDTVRFNLDKIKNGEPIFKFDLRPKSSAVDAGRVQENTEKKQYEDPIIKRDKEVKEMMQRRIDSGNAFEGDPA